VPILKSSITVHVLRFCMQTSVCRRLRSSVDGDPVVLIDVHSVGEPSGMCSHAVHIQHPVHGHCS